MTVSYDKPDLHRVFTQKSLNNFRYLAAYGCELTSIEEDRYVVEITYKNQTTGIKVSFEFRENQIFVYLIRLINEEIPAYLDAPSRWFYLDNLVELRSPSTTLPRKEFGDWLTPDDINDILTAYASALKEYGEDVLRGDFSVFAELAQQIDRPKSSSSIDEVRLKAEPSIGDYDQLTVEEVAGRLAELSADEVEKLKAYEKNNKNRDTTYSPKRIQ